MKKTIIFALTALFCFIAFLPATYAGAPDVSGDGGGDGTVIEQNLLANFTNRIQHMVFRFDPSADSGLDSKEFYYWKDADGIFQPSDEGKWGPIPIGTWTVTATANDNWGRELFQPHVQTIIINDGQVSYFTAPQFVLAEKYRHEFTINGLEPNENYEVRATDQNGATINTSWMWVDSSGRGYFNVSLPLNMSETELVFLRNSQIVGTIVTTLDPTNQEDLELNADDLEPATTPAGHGYAEMIGTPTFSASAEEYRMIRVEAYKTLYILRDGYRYALPYLWDHPEYEEAVLTSWGWNRDDFEIVSMDELESYRIKGIITIHPGTFLVRQENGSPYEVVGDASLAPISEENAIEKYGDGWMNKVITCPDAYWGSYRIVELYEAVTILSANTPASQTLVAGVTTDFTRFIVSAPAETDITIKGFSIAGHGLFVQNDIVDIHVYDCFTNTVISDYMLEMTGGQVACDEFTIAAGTNQEFIIRATVGEGCDGHQIGLDLTSVIAEDINGNPVTVTGPRLNGNVMSLVE